MIEHTVKDNADTRLVKGFAHLPQIFIVSQPAVQLQIIPGVISMGIRLKKRAEIHRIDPQPGHMGNPVRYFMNPMCQHPVVSLRHLAEAK